MALDCGSNITGLASNTVQGFFIMNIITFTFLLLCLVPFRVQLVTGCDKLHKLHTFKFFTGVFTKIHCIWDSIIGLYRVAHLCRKLYAPVRKSTRNNQELNKRPIQTAPPMDEYTTGFQIRLTLVLDANSPLLAPLMTEESTSKAVLQPPKLPKPTEDKGSDSETPVSQVTQLLGTTPRENHQLQHKNTPDDISDILGTRVYQGYVETPVQTLDGIVVNQLKRFLPLVEEAKCLAKEIRIKKLNEQWSGIPHEQLLNQSTPAMPLMATGATVPRLYSHVAHLVDKERVKYPNHLKVQNRSKPEVEVNLKENLMNKDRTHLKPKRQMKLIHMIALTIITTMILILPQVRVKAADPLMVKVGTDNLEVSHKETEAKDLNIVNVNFRTIDFREAHFNRTILNTAIIANPTFREIKQIATEAEAMAGVLSNLEDAVEAEPIIRVAMERINISITRMTHRQNSMAHLVVYTAVLIIPLSTVTRENMT